MALDLCQNTLFPLNILRTNGDKFTKYYICIYIDKIYLGNVTLYFLLMCTRVMARDLCQNFVSTQYLENYNGHNFTKFYMCIQIDKIYVGIVT